MEKATWQEYEDLARERRRPPTVDPYRWPEPSLFEQFCEWIGRHWLLYLLLVAVAIAAGCLLMDAVRR